MGVNVSAGCSVNEGTIGVKSLSSWPQVSGPTFATASPSLVPLWYAGLLLLPVPRPSSYGGSSRSDFFRTTDERTKSTDGRMAFAMHACCRKALLHMALADADGSATKSERLAAGDLVRT